MPNSEPNQKSHLAASTSLITTKFPSVTLAKRKEQLSTHVTQSTGISTQDVAVSVAVLPREATANITAVRTAARAYLQEVSRPWDEATRIFPNTILEEVMKDMDGFEAAYANAVGEFIRDYPKYVEDMKARLGATFDPSDYMPAEALKERLKSSVVYSVLADASDFRHLGEAAAAKAAVAAAKMQVSVSDDLVSSVVDVLDRLVHATGESRLGQGANKSPRLRETMLIDLDNVLDLASKMLHPDDHRHGAVNTIKKTIAKYSHEELKINPQDPATVVNRAIVHEQAKVLADKLRKKPGEPHEQKEVPAATKPAPAPVSVSVPAQPGTPGSAGAGVVVPALVSPRTAKVLPKFGA